MRYVRDGSKLLQELHADYTVTFLYNDADVLVGFRYGDNNYFYGADSLGVIHYIYNEAGSVVVTYTYDAWGNTISATGNSTLIEVNPIRYKSYYYDAETGFYYLQSRYYDPQVGRFISADEIDYLGVSGTVLGYNLFVYCENNPVNGDDPSGLFSIPRGIISFAIDAIIWAVFSEGALTFAFLTQPVKAIARSAGKAFIKAKMMHILRGFSDKIATAIIKVSASLVPVIKKAAGWLFKKWAAKLTATALASKISGGLISLVSNKFLDAIATNITAFLSVGGLIGGLWDYFSDGEMNGWIYLW